MDICKINSFFALRTLRFLHIHFPKVTECRIWNSGFYLMEQKFIPSLPPPKPPGPSLSSPVTPSGRVTGLPAGLVPLLSHSQGKLPVMEQSFAFCRTLSPGPREALPAHKHWARGAQQTLPSAQQTHLAVLIVTN